MIQLKNVCLKTTLNVKFFLQLSFFCVVAIVVTVDTHNWIYFGRFLDVFSPQRIKVCLAPPLNVFFLYLMMSQIFFMPALHSRIESNMCCRCSVMLSLNLAEENLGRKVSACPCLNRLSVFFSEACGENEMQGRYFRILSEARRVLTLPPPESLMRRRETKEEKNKP